GFASALVAGCGHQPARLVQEQIAGHGPRGVLAIDVDAGATDVDRVLRITHHPAVDHDPAFADPAFGLAARTDAALGQRSREPVTGARARRVPQRRSPSSVVGAGAGSAVAGTAASAAAGASAPGAAGATAGTAAG